MREPYDAAADVERRADRQLRVIGVLFALDLVLIGAIILVGLFWPGKAAAQIPRDALRYRADLTREARLAWGLNAPIADFAAQIHQESLWRPDAVSRAGALGMAQFMPSTARWWCELHRLSARECQPEHPTWALRALVGYDRWLWDRIQNTSGPCDRLAFALSAYNGGLGWVQRDRALASSKGLDAGRYWDAVETVNAGRAAWAIKENRGYPRRILYQLAPRYATWGPSACN